MVLQLRHRLILVWLGTILLAMGVAAALFMVLLLDFHQANAEARLLAGFSQLHGRLDELTAIVRENGRRFAERQEIVASLSMIDRYEAPAAYQPLVFDPEKKRLADALADLMQAVGLPQGALYSRDRAVAGFGRGGRAYLSYGAAGRPLPMQAEGRDAAFAVRDDLPVYLRSRPLRDGARTDRVQLIGTDGGAAIEGWFPLTRALVGGAEVVGHLGLWYYLDDGFVDDVSRSLDLDVRICGERFPPVGAAALPCPPRDAAGPDLARLIGTDTPPLWLASDSHYAAAIRLPLAAGDAHVVLGLDKVFLNAQLRALRLALLAGLGLATALILGFGVLYLRATLSHPLERLLRGIEAVAKGRFIAVAGADKDDELGRVAGAFNAMAAKLEAEQRKLRTLNAELEQRVARRTAELAHARDNAEAANRAKSLFLANMSHELRTPLNAILGFAQLMQQDRNLTAKQKNDLVVIDSSGQHLLGLINDVLEISRIESGRITLEAKVFNLPRMLAAVADMIRVRADKQGLVLRTEFDELLPDYVEGDEHRLRQVLINLLGNAVKYTASGWIALRVRPDPGRSVLRFEVEDSGHGIAGDDLKRIFEPFFQTEEGAAKGEGTGLGLAISRQYVALMGGELAVESRLGHGSLFRFSLPLRAVDSAAVEPVNGERKVVGLEPGQRGFRILVVEDNEDNRRLLRRIHDRVGLAIKEAVDGREAVELFQRWRPHLVWMDMRMPVMDGYEATRRIKASPAAQDTVVVALTASAFEEERDEVLAAGCDDFLRKPVNQALIYQALERHLGLRFRYAEQEPEEATLPAQEVAQGLRQLPGELRARLHEQALALETDAAAATVAEIGRSDPRLAEALRRLLGDYRFDELLRWLEEDERHDPREGGEPDDRATAADD